MATEAAQTNGKLATGDATLRRGYKSCKSACRTAFGDFGFAVSNLPQQQRHGLYALGNFLVECIDLLDLESVSGLSLDVWQEIHDDLDDALAGHPASPTQAALLDTVKRFDVPKEHLFEMLGAADWWIRNRGCQTFDQTAVFAARFGGNMMAACTSVLGVTRPGHEAAAIQCGQAIHLTQMLAHLVSDLKEQKFYLAREDYTDCRVDTARIKMRQGSPELRHFIRQYTARIEKLFLEGGQLTAHLDFGGVRTVSSLLDYHWKMFSKIRTQPQVILEPHGVMTRQDKFKLRTRHVLGLEGKAPVIAHGGEHH